MIFFDQFKEPTIKFIIYCFCVDALIELRSRCANQTLSVSCIVALPGPSIQLLKVSRPGIKFG